MPNSEQKGLFDSAAARIAKRIASEGIWRGDRCTWSVEASQRSGPPDVRGATEIAGGNLYQGSSGIGLFLAAYHQASGDPIARKTALGAIRHALDEAHESPSVWFGLYNGYGGVAWAAARVGEMLDSDEVAHEAATLFEQLEGGEESDPTYDVISGAAGWICALLDVEHLLDSSLVERLARKAGDRLIMAAQREPRGWCWTPNYPTYSHVRHLTGLSHGAAGIGHALLALFARFGDSRHGYAARQAFAYEEQFFDESANNWLGLDRLPISQFLLSNSPSDLVQHWKNGSIVPYAPRCNVSWCHGAPGIGLARLRAFEVLGDRSYLKEGQIATQTTLDGLNSQANFSLCHGVAGNCETLIYAHGVSDDPTLMARVNAEAQRGIEAFGTRDSGWPCGTRTGDRDPGLMLGEAGIGYFLLRLANPSLPSILQLPNTFETRLGADTTCPAEEELWIRKFFGQSLDVIERLAPEVLSEQSQKPTAESSPVERTYAMLQAATKDSLSGALQAQAVDAHQVEKAKYLLTLAPHDFSEQSIYRLQEPPASPEHWLASCVRLAPTVVILHRTWNWDEWLTNGAQVEPEPTDGGQVYAVMQDRTLASAIRLEPLAAWLLEGIDDGGSPVVDLLTGLSGAFGGSEIGEEVLPALLAGQLSELHKAGLVCAYDG